MNDGGVTRVREYSPPFFPGLLTSHSPEPPRKKNPFPPIRPIPTPGKSSPLRALTIIPRSTLHTHPTPLLTSPKTIIIINKYPIPIIPASSPLFSPHKNTPSNSSPHPRKSFSLLTPHFPYQPQKSYPPSRHIPLKPPPSTQPTLPVQHLAPDPDSY